MSEFCFCFKRYAVREAKKWRYAVRKAKIGQYAVRKGEGGVKLNHVALRKRYKAKCPNHVKLTIWGCFGHLALYLLFKKLYKQFIGVVTFVFKA